MTASRSFHSVIDKYRKFSFSERDKGDKFERLIQAYLQTDPKYSYKFKHVWMWNDFPSKNDFGGKDTGIDLVAKTNEGDYWAIQCKCYQHSSIISKKEVDSFLSTSSRKFMEENLNRRVEFSHRLWISTTNKWGGNAEETIRNQNPPVSRANLSDLENAPVEWGKLEEGIYGDQARCSKYSLKPHQREAINCVQNYLKSNDRGKLIMACGTGKTFTSLKIAENQTNNKGLILFLVPSIALVGQTLTEWTSQAKEPINSICICSDSKITQKKTKREDIDGFNIIDLALPASTDVNNISKQLQIARAKNNGMTVVFSTYQSIDVIAKAQEQFICDTGSKDLGEFDLILCDEAHRTTGVTLADTQESSFVKVHDNEFIKAKKRIYMTATPRLFSDDSKSKAAQSDALLCSMDDEGIYGEEMYRIGFGEAVEKNLLTDYKVLILTMNENDVPTEIQRMISDENMEINSDDAHKLIGCINAFSKQVVGDDNGDIRTVDPLPMKRAVAFCPQIKASKQITHTFNSTASVYIDSLNLDKREKIVNVSSNHIDGSMSAPKRDELLNWLKTDSEDDNECRVLTNVRCLSEGVDVPSLDAVLFLSARNSQVDVVQSVGRVMRLSSGKKYGYIIIPVVIPVDVKPEEALNDNERYRVVWSVLNALRAHDDRFNATVNQINLNKKKPNQISIVGIGDQDRESKNEKAHQLQLQFEQLQSVMYAKMVQKVGDRKYWENWAKDVAIIAERYIERINRLINKEATHKKAFIKFLKGLRENINPYITNEEAVEMLAQHIITKPVFEALFENYSFVKNNAISIAMQHMLDLLEDNAMDEDSKMLNKFYESVQKRIKGIDNAEGKQKIIVELYDKFFKTAFPKMVEKLGIVYTPVEVVDFILHSVDGILKKEFGRGISDENVNVLDPFTGTGTFITRLLQSGLIKKEDLERKYTKELHANELVLLAYYIAAVNIENVYHDILDGKDNYESFDGICLTDTFQTGEITANEEWFSDFFPENSERVHKQKKSPLRVIIGNPPYSVGQRNANDNAQNLKYDVLDKRIADTYAKKSRATNVNSLYDSYIKAFRWSSDRIDKDNGGIISFVSNGAWLDGNSTDGFRKCLEDEFSSIYIFNLRGNQRTSGELSRKEGGKIFGSGSRTPISITLLVKNPAAKNKKAKIHYYDIGDYLKREEKLKIIEECGSIDNIKFKTIKPNKEGDWLNQRNEKFGEYIPLVPEKSNTKFNSFFSINSLGLTTSRDSWCINYSKDTLGSNIDRMICYYNQQLNNYNKGIDKVDLESFIDTNEKKIKWTRSLKKSFVKGNVISYDSDSIRTGNYRPFISMNFYFSRELNEYVYKIPKIFPSDSHNNIIICISSSGSSKGLSVLASNRIVDAHYNGDTQIFPLYYYEKNTKQELPLFDKNGNDEYIRRDGISDFILKRAKEVCGKNVSKEDIFYYVYGVLHNDDYRKEFSSDLKKMLPRIPMVEKPKDFWAFSKAGRELAELHINYESVEPYEGVIVEGEDSGFFNVVKMKFPKKDEKGSIIFNSKITITNIPEEAYRYVVNGKSAIEWIMERYQVKTDKKSGIKNDPNDWAEEVGNERYILDLLLSVINLSVKTVEIVKNLPKMKF